MDQTAGATSAPLLLTVPTWIVRSASPAGFAYSLKQRVTEQWLFHDRNRCFGRARSHGGVGLADEKDGRRLHLEGAQPGD